LHEDAPLAARYLNAYSETKARAERLVRPRSRHIILRPHAIYGPGDRVLLPKLLEANYWRRQLAIGDGSNYISLTHVDNLVDATVLGLQALLRGKPTGIFNVADDAPVRLDTALRAVLVAIGRDVRIVYLPRTLAYAAGALLEWVFAPLGAKQGPCLTRYRVVQLADEYTLDLTRAKTLLGYRPTRSLLRFIADGGFSDS
jgi:nucleoside-diphosphate-sugar epimerase